MTQSLQWEKIVIVQGDVTETLNQPIRATSGDVSWEFLLGSPNGADGRLRWMVELTALVPCTQPEKPNSPFPEEAFRSFEDFAIDLADGYTREPDTEGGWRDDNGSVIREPSRKYVLFVSPVSANGIQAQLAARIRSQFRQKAACVIQRPVITTAF